MKPRIAVIGAGKFGQNHIRIASDSPRADLVAIVDTNRERAVEAAAARQCAAYQNASEILGKVDCAIIAAPTSVHAEIGCALLKTGIDVLIEKPITPTLADADLLIEAARIHGRILQVGHLERFNPAVLALEKIAKLPLFFEVHRMSVFSPRSLDVDVVLDLMIHDLDVVLALAHGELEEIRAAGISILSPKVDIANVRLQFNDGCVANLTASRVSIERIRKLRVFQPRQYISLDYAAQSLIAISVDEQKEVSFDPVEIVKGEPLQLQFDAFLDSVESRSQPKLDGATARRTLEVALRILDKIEEHSRVVAKTLNSAWKP